MNILAVSFIVFSIVLVLTKAKILAAKREFVEKRYEASKVAGGKPNFIHRWFHSIWNCPMCCGWWIALIVCWFYPVYGYVADVFIVFGINWLLHCLENILFYSGKKLEEQ